MDMTPASVVKDFYRYQQWHVCLWIAWISTMTIWVGILLVFKGFSSNPKAAVLAIGFIVPFVVAVFLEHRIKTRIAVCEKYLARRSPSELSIEELNILFQALKLRDYPRDIQRDMSYIPFLQHYCKGHAPAPLTGHAKGYAKRLWFYRRHLYFLEPNTDWTWIAHALGKSVKAIANS